MRGSAGIYVVRVAQFVLKIEKLSHIMGPRASQDLRSPSLIMAPALEQFWKIFGNLRKVVGNFRKIVKNAVISMLM